MSGSSNIVAFSDSIECSVQPLDLAFHPTKENLVALALIDGTLEVHDIYQQDDSDVDGGDSEDEDGPDSILSSFALHTEMLPQKKSQSGEQPSLKQASCRSVLFSNDGTRIFTGGSEGHLCCVDATRAGAFTTASADEVLLWRIPDASSGKHVPIHALHCMTSGPFENSLVVGDDAGAVRLWDVRQCGSSGKVDASMAASQSKWPKGCIMSWKESADYISDFDQSSDGNTLLATTADGKLSVFDLRMVKKYKPNTDALRISDDLEDELLSIKIIKNGNKVICGSQQGILNVFSWGTWGDISDRFPGHPNSIDALLKVDENTLLTGSSDGIIRVVSIHPDKLIGVLGDDHGGFPIEKLQFNAGRKVVASLTHDSVVRLWDARILDDTYDDSESDEVADAKSAKAASKLTASKASDSDSDGLSDGSHDDNSGLEDEEDSDDESDDEPQPTANQNRAKRLKTSNEIFFADL